MTQHVVWVHGIGDHHAGYSRGWTAAFDRYLRLGADAYVEVVWETVFDGAPRGRALRAAATATRREAAAAEAVHEELRAMLLARAGTRATPRARPTKRPAARAATRSTRKRTARSRSAATGVVEWPPQAQARGLFDPFKLIDEYLGDFAKYLAIRPVRDAVKACLKEKLRPLVDSGDRVAVIAHSWGTVVSYDTLLDLAREVPAARVATLITLGSPLWAVRQFLEDRSGHKPPELATWVNIHARGDLVGSWLNPAYRVDKEFEVPSIGRDAHGSYFVDENAAVQHDLVPQYVL